MLLQRFPVKHFLQCRQIEPGCARLIKKSEIIDHAAKLSPHEQCATAFGFVTLNPPFCKSSLKSRTEPLTKSARFGSTTMRTLEVGTRMSRSFGPSTKSSAYGSPEQPPPTTASRSAPFGFPFCWRSDASLFAMDLVDG